MEFINFQCYYWKICSNSCHFVIFVMFDSFLIFICLFAHLVKLILFHIFRMVVDFSSVCKIPSNIFGFAGLMVMDSFNFLFIYPLIMNDSFAVHSNLHWQLFFSMEYHFMSSLLLEFLINKLLF
jgi:hypothetical protein